MQIKQLQLLFAAGIVIEDKTSGPLGQFDDSVVKPLQAIDDLSALGFIRFGCYGATTADTGLGADRAVAMFLMFRADAAAKQATIDNTYVVRPFFDRDLHITRLVLVDRIDLDQIGA